MKPGLIAAVVIAGVTAGVDASIAGSTAESAASQWATITIDVSSQKASGPPPTVVSRKKSAKAPRAGAQVVPARVPFIPTPGPFERGESKTSMAPQSTTAEVKAAKPQTAACDPGIVERPNERKPGSQAYVSAVQKFCANIVPAALDARFAWQRRTLGELEKEITDRIVRLDAKIAEHGAWLAKREEFAARANNALMQVFTKLKPEAAALQLAEMDDYLAAALVMKLDPKVSAPILSEVEPAKAAQIARLLSAAAKSGDKHRPADAAPRATNAPVTKEAGR